MRSEAPAGAAPAADPVVSVRALRHAYEVRVIDAGRPWWRDLLRAQYRRHAVLDDVNLELTGSGVTALLGANGAGKTTLLKILAGVLTPAAGEVRVLGHEPHRRRPAFLRRLGVVFGHKRMLWPELSLHENLRLVAAIYAVPPAEARTRAAELIELFRLGDLAARPLKSYSLGEGMKAEIAAVLSFAPDLVFLDEPTIGLDLRSQHTFRAALAEVVARRRCHVILTSHNMRDVAELASRAYVLAEGRVAEVALERGPAVQRQARLEERLMAL